MKLKIAIVVTLLIACAAPMSFAQDKDEHEPGGPPPGPGGSEWRHRPPSPLMVALDLNHDGILSKDEIAKASESLKTLDKNGDGQLTPDELRPPPRHEGDHGPQGSSGATQGQPPPPLPKGGGKP